MRVLRGIGARAVRCLPAVAPATRPGDLRALRRPDSLAGRALPRVCGAPPRLSARAGCGRLLRRGARSRRRVERTRAPPRGRPGRRARGGATRGSGGRRHHLYPARSGTASRPRSSSGRPTCAGARRPLVPPGDGSARPSRRGIGGPPDPPGESGPPPQRARRLRRGRRAAPERAPRRRRVHDGRHRLGGGDGPSARGCAERRRGHLRPHRASLVSPRARPVVLGYAHSSAGPPPRRSR